MKVEIVVNGHAAPTVEHKGQTYALVPDSGNYEIRLTHNGLSFLGARNLAVVSVDGINVINGEDASYDGPGYIVTDTTVIKGWLRGDQEAAAFTLGDSKESYAAQMGKGTDNTGIIGVAWFNEEHLIRKNPTDWSPTWPWAQPPTWGNSPITWDTTDPLLGAPTTASVANTKSILRGLGTGYGEEVGMKTTTTTFTRQGTPYIQTIRYGNREQLEAWGVPVAKLVAKPNAFPGNNFVPAPPNWKSKKTAQSRR